ncbi:MAG: hypothetical protein WA210_20580 [Burkholderiaceae bacterium]
MNFFDVLFWMGALCLVPIVIAIIRDALSEAPVKTDISFEPSFASGPPGGNRTHI